MKSWKIRKITDHEYHVIESRFVGEPEYVLAKCHHATPAGEIVASMRVASSFERGESSIHGAIFNMAESLKRLQADIADAREGRYDESSEKQEGEK